MNDDAITRDRIIHVAAELFAAQGYRQVSARTVCAKAEANHAAINYYFRNKLNLYREVLIYAYDKLMRAQPLPNITGSELVAREELQVWLTWYMGRLFSSPETLFAWRLISRELQEPSEVFDSVSDQFMTPVFMSLEKIVRGVIGSAALKAPGADRMVRATTMSIISQCLIYLMGRPMVERLMPNLYLVAESKTFVADLIFSFSLNGIMAVKRELTAAA